MELGFFAAEGLDASVELIFPNYRAYEALRDGRVELVAGPAHAALRPCPQWQGLKLLGALTQGMFWLLVMRADISATPGDVGGGAAARSERRPCRMMLKSSLLIG